MQVTDELREVVDQTATWIPQLVAATAALTVLAFVGHLAGRALRRFVLEGRASARFATVASRVVRWAFTLLGLLIALQLLGLTAVAGSLLATGGLLAVILGFAFRSIGENLLAGVFLGMSRSFDVGDLVETAGHMGVVRDIDLRSVHVRAADGRDIFIPCAQVFSSVLVNYTRTGTRRGEFVVGVDYAEDPERVRTILARATRGVRGVLEMPAPSVQISAFVSQYMELRVLFWVDTQGETGLAAVRTDAMRACLLALKDEGVVISSDVSSALTLAPIEVAVREPRG
jgi:small conductance mechanosensitive channel